MVKVWQQVPFDADAADMGATIIRITRGKKGDAMASVERMQWLEPDGHEHTGYADVVADPRRRAAEVLPEYRKTGAVVALESDDLWDAAWGDLRNQLA